MCYRLPTDEELFAHLPGAGEWPGSQYGTMAQQYARKMDEVEQRIPGPGQDQTGLPASECTAPRVRQLRHDAMGRWLLSYLRQYRPIEAYPQYSSGPQELAMDGPCMIADVYNDLEEIDTARARLERFHLWDLIRSALLTLLFWGLTMLCEHGMDWYLAGDFSAVGTGTGALLLVHTLSVVLFMALTASYISLVGSAAALVIALLAIPDCFRAKDAFESAFVRCLPGAYQYLRFCQLWCTSAGRPMPEELSRGMEAVQDAVALYNRIYP